MIRTPALIKKKSAKTKSASSIKNADNTSTVDRIRRRKKIRATEDFNHLNRSSLAFDFRPEKLENHLSQVRMNTRKIQEYNYLPKVLLDEKENDILISTQHNIKKNNRVVESSSSSTSNDEATLQIHMTTKKKKLFTIDIDEAQRNMTGKFDERNLDIKPKKCGRKSVRFLSPKENTERKRNTFELEKPTTDIDLLLSMNENDGTPKQRQLRKDTPYVKNVRGNTSIITRETLEYSSDSETEEIEDDVFDEPEVSIPIHKEAAAEISGTNKAEISKHAVFSPVKLKKAPISILRKSTAMNTKPEIPIATQMKHEFIQSSLHKKPLTKSVFQKFNSMTPNKFGTKKKSLNTNLHKSMIDLNKKTPVKSLQRGSVANSVNITRSKLTSLSNKNDGRDESVAASPVQSNGECLNITLNISDQSLIGICLNSTRKNLRRSISTPAIQNSDEIELSPITVSSTPERRTSSIIDLISPSRDSSFRQTMSPLVEISATKKSWRSEADNLNALPKRANSTRKRWNKSLDVEILDCTGNTVLISSPWKSNNVAPPSTNMNKDSDNKKRKSISPIKNNSIQKTKPSTRKKMPNFALIHQMAFDKMENLQELTERKAARALQLLSGKKPEERRQLRSPKCRKPLKYSPVAARQKKYPVKGKSKTNIDKLKPITNPKEAKISKPVQKKSEQQTKTKPTVPKTAPKEQNKKPLSRLGFKADGPPSKSKDKEELKAAASRSSILKNTVDTRRTAVHNIRSNRRFELLMKMRAKK